MAGGALADVDYVAGSSAGWTVVAPAAAGDPGEAACCFAGPGASTAAVLALLQQGRPPAPAPGIVAARTLASVTRAEREAVQRAHRADPLPEGPLACLLFLFLGRKWGAWR